jgi:hypothetical protein
MNQKIGVRRTRPTVNAVPWPKLLDTSLSTMIQTMNSGSSPTPRRRNPSGYKSRNHPQVFGRPAMRSSTMNW